MLEILRIQFLQQLINHQRKILNGIQILIQRIKQKKKNVRNYLILMCRLSKVRKEQKTKIQGLKTSEKTFY